MTSANMSKCFVIVLLLDCVISKQVNTTSNPYATTPESIATTAELAENNPVPVTDDPEPVGNDPEPVENDIEPVAIIPNFHWRYGAESTWPGQMCQPGEGKRQSPINILTSKMIQDFREEYIKHGPLKFKGYHDVLLTGINNGQTLQFSTDGEYRMHPTLTGGPLKRHYRLEQLHFHWLSEHSVDGQKFPLELHFVHVRSDLEVDQALRVPDGLAIVAVFGNVHPELSTAPSAISYELMQQLGILLSPGLRTSGVILDLNQILSPNRKVYYTYEGSLTTPECNEAVIWIIFKQPIYISDEQYRLFFKSSIRANNTRSIQRSSSETKVWATPNREVTTPVIIRYFNDFTAYIRDLFVNITMFLAKGLREDTL